MREKAAVLYLSLSRNLELHSRATSALQSWLVRSPPHPSGAHS
eukprot:CAMPEP_0118861044 /NCGR_PEP_ID=MMETSP1163-20130328/6707_1 /TAXON_ID=124430 /ORGANISM="Phaeomonas parva, Strain CCMP2877" /LENGTH=42 /DNA_ID= /DNA_START= /DNA_END= /DNA_ORIENTATION=